MKKSSKIKTLTVLFAVAILSLTFFASCNASDVQKLIDNNISNVTPTKLDTPTNIELGSDDILRWNNTENASSYVVNIDGVNYSTSVPSLDLAKTLKENGEYEAYIKALSDRSGYVDSEFSAPYKFTFNGIKLIEDGNKTSGMFGLFDDLYTKEAYIGYGYDVIGSSYVNSDEVKMNYRIFDQDKLKTKQLVMIKDHDSVDYYISGDSLSSYQASVEAKLNSKVNVGKVFAMSIKGKFKSTTKTTASALFYEYSHTTKAYQLILQCDFEDYKDMLTSAFKRDLMTLDIGTLFTRYGTHVITSVVMGGRFDLDYTMLSDSLIDTMSLSASLDTTFKAWGVNTSIDVSASVEEIAKEDNTTVSSESRCYGGDYIQMNNEKAIIKNYQAWLSTIENKPALVGIRDINSLVPIWELLGDSAEERARKEELYNAFEKYGEESYNSLLEYYDITPVTAPTSLNIYLTDKSGKKIDQENISAGERVYLKTEVEPEIAVYTKKISFDKENYVEYNSPDNSIKISEDTPDDTIINLTVDIGHGLKKIISMTVYKYYNITFNTNGGSEIEAITKIRSGQRVDEPEKPTKPDKYKFAYWYYVNEENDEVKFSFSERIHSDMVIFVAWEEIYPTVTYVHNIDDYEGDTEEKVEYGKTLALPELTQYGYKFAGYYTDKEMLIPFDRKSEIKSDISVYVKWEKEEYTVTFEPNGGSAVEPQKVKYKDKAIKATTTKEGSDFGNWYKDIDLGQVFDFNNEIITKDITLYAKWIVNGDGVSVNFDTCGGNALDGQIINYGTSLGENLFTPKRTGYMFKGWFKEKEYINEVYETTIITAKCTLYAQWEANSYTVKFDSNGGVGSMSDEEFTYDKAKALTENSYTKKGYKFIGWLSEDGQTVYADKQIIRNLAEAGDVILTAKWEADEYVIYFDKNSPNLVNNRGVIIEKEEKNIRYGEEINLNTEEYTPECDYYVFKGWGLSPDSEETLTDNFPYEYAKDITLYAIWEQVYDGVYIVDVEGLKGINNDLSASYYLIDDIDMEGSKWAPLGTFSGKFDGLNHSIYNYYIIDSDYKTGNAYCYGLFSLLSSAGTIENLQIGKEGYTTYIKVGEENNSLWNVLCNVGMITGSCNGVISSCKIVNCSIHTYVRMQDERYSGWELYSNVGGICGVLRYGIVKGCSISSRCDFYSSTWSRYNHIKNTARTGGIVGYACDCEISDCLVENSLMNSNAVTGDVEWNSLNRTGAPNSRTGGIAGTIRKENQTPTIVRCIVKNTNNIDVYHKQGNGTSENGQGLRGLIAAETNSTAPNNLIGVGTILSASGTNSSYPISVISSDSFEALISQDKSFNNGYWYSDSEGKIALRFNKEN